MLWGENGTRDESPVVIAVAEDFGRYHSVLIRAIHIEMNFVVSTEVPELVEEHDILIYIFRMVWKDEVNRTATAREDTARVIPEQRARQEFRRPFVIETAAGHFPHRFPLVGNDLGSDELRQQHSVDGVLLSEVKVSILKLNHLVVGLVRNVFSFEPSFPAYEIAEAEEKFNRLSG